MKKIFLSLVLLWSFVMARSEVRVIDMEVCGLGTPLGIDQVPVFSWKTESDTRGFRQETYEVNVYDAEGNLKWTTGSVLSSSQNNIVYAGEELKSCSDYIWNVKVTGKSGEESEIATSKFSTAFLSSTEWQAEWIGINRSNTSAKYEIVFKSPIETRFLKLDVTRLGLAVSTEPDLYYMQLSEVEIYSGDKNLALTANVTSNDSYDVSGSWDLTYVNDGIINGSKLGYTSKSYSDPDHHIWMIFDLGGVQAVDRLVLYPRQDESSVESGKVANFPSSFTIQSSVTDQDYTIQFTARDLEAPDYKNWVSNIPYFGKSFLVEKRVKRARIYASALGVFTMKLNGKPVTENKLEPGESEYTKTVLYSTYDVTDLVVNGENAMVAQVAGGIFDVKRLGGVAGLSPRYTKELTNSGESSLKAELHIEYEDGTVDKICTDDSWRTTCSPTTGSNWWGGEDYDARMQIDGLDRPDFDFSQWDRVAVLSPTFSCSQSQGPVGELRSRMYEPLKIVEEWNAKSVKKVISGGQTYYVVDFGKNFAGQFRFNLQGKNGQMITLRTGSLLNQDGTVQVEVFNTPPFDIYDSYIFRGDESGETWGPEFMYHGMRYLQISGLDEAPLPEKFVAYRIRCDVADKGSFVTSNELINKIHVICRDAIQSQIYNAFTDCPHREKLGWLDVPNEMYNSICYNYDMSAYWNKVVLDCFDAQYANGKVPSTVPHFWGDWDDDPNWGGSAIFVPYRTWKTYGDKTLMTNYYNGMKKLIDYYTSLTSGYIMPGSSYSALSDWGQGSAGLAHQTAAEFTITTTYYFLLNAVGEMADELGYYIDAYHYREIAKNVRKAFNERFYDASTGIYEHGNQGEFGMPLYYGLVDPENEEKVAAKLAEAVKNANYKIKTGEIALKPVLMSLAKYGYNDVVYKMANQTDYPSYGYFVVNGCTTTPEYWDMSYSQNHCMMDHIEEWFFSEIGGIKNNGMAYSEFTIQPWIPSDMDKMKTTVGTIFGTIKSEYEKVKGEYIYRFDIPSNTLAKIIVPLGEGHRLMENGKELLAGEDGIEEVFYTDSLATVILGSGSYEFYSVEGVSGAIGVNENLWLPLHENVQLETGTVLRLGLHGVEGYLGAPAKPIASGDNISLVGLDKMSNIEVKGSKLNAFNGVFKPFYFLEDEESGLGICQSNGQRDVLFWGNEGAVGINVEMEDNGAKLYASSLSDKGFSGYLYVDEDDFTVGVSDNNLNMAKWEIYKKNEVGDSSLAALNKAIPGQDMVFYDRECNGRKKYETIVLPFDVEDAGLLSGYEFYMPVKVQNGTMSVQKMTQITAGTACLVRKKTSSDNTGLVLSLNGKFKSVDLSSGILSGSYILSDIEDVKQQGKELYVLNNEGTSFVPAGQYDMIKPFHAYLLIDSNLAYQEITIMEEPETSIKEPLETSRSIDGHIYDMGGRVVKKQCNTLHQGIYIYGGKKRMITK